MMRHTAWMPTSVSRYHRHRFPAEIISHCVWLYFRFAERVFAAYGQSFMTLALHQMSHRSHLTDARRAAARTAACDAGRQLSWKAPGSS